MDGELDVSEIWFRDPGLHLPTDIQHRTHHLDGDLEMQETERLLQVEPGTLDEALVVIERLRQRLRQHGPQEGGGCSLEAYFQKSLVGHLMQRLPWLMSLLLLESVSAYSLGRFESMLDHHMTLALFCPMIVGTAGNAGNQPGVIFTRAITTGQFDVDHSMLDFFRRESILAVIVSATMAVLGLLRTTATSSDICSCIAVSIAIFLVIMFAIGSGLIFSLLIHRCGCDPAAGAAPLLTTMSDVIGVLMLCFVSMAIFQANGRTFGAP